MTRVTEKNGLGAREREGRKKRKEKKRKKKREGKWTGVTEVDALHYDPCIYLYVCSVYTSPFINLYSFPFLSSYITHFTHSTFNMRKAHWTKICM